MAKKIMIQGTMSNAGKSILVTALCRIFTEDGYRVAPFKSQNMALNSFITEDGYEMGRAQVVQAEACKKKPSYLMNPILLKPTTDVGSQVIVNGKPIGNMRASEYFKMKKELIPDILSAFKRLEEENDIIVIEGAGSPAEINLKTNDIVNMGLAKMLNAPVLLVGDIDRGGVFAQLYGTVKLLEEDECNLIKGLIINKFRGDKSILQSGLDKIEELTSKKVVGVVPYVYVDIDDEDSLSEKLNNNIQKAIDIVIIKLPRISNFTDFNSFNRFENVSIRYVNKVKDLKNPDMIIIPGTKSTISDLLWLRQSGLESAILKERDKGKIIFGICGGYQMLGRTLSDPENVEGGGSVNGLSLLPIDTVFSKDKLTEQVEGKLENISGELKVLNGLPYVGYEIHNGVSSIKDVIISNGNIYGTYVHGIFDSNDIATNIIKYLCEKKNIKMDDVLKFDINEYKDKQYDILASTVRDSLDMDFIYKILNES